MKRLPMFGMAALLASGAVSANGFDACDADSSYDLTLATDAVVFSRDAVAPMRVEMRGGRLVVDGRDEPLTDADAQHIATFEREVRALVPEAKAIAIDAVDVATEAVVHVAGAFIGGEPRAAAELRALGAKIGQRIERSTGTAEWRDDAFDASIDALAAEAIPLLAGDIAAATAAAVFSGDTDDVQRIEQRAGSLGQDVEARVRAKSGAIEARAKALCPRVQALDRIETALAWRSADGQALDIVQIGAD